MFSGSNFSPEKSLQKILSRKICRFFVSKISPATGVRLSRISGGGDLFSTEQLKEDSEEGGESTVMTSAR